MQIIKSKKDLNKFKKIENGISFYQFDEDVVFDFNFKLGYDLDFNQDIFKVKDLPQHTPIIIKGNNMIVNKDIEWIDRLYLQGNLECAAKISGDVFQIEKDVKVKDLECYVLECKNLQGEKIIINENLACLGKIECEELYAKHISSFKQLKAKAMAYNGTMFLNISAESEVLDIPKRWRKLT